MTSILKVTLKRGYNFQIFCCVWHSCLVIPDCDTATSPGLSFCCSLSVKVEAFSLSTSPSFYTFFTPLLAHSVPPLWLGSLIALPQGRDMDLFFFSSTQWPQQTLTRTFAWHQLPKTINMLCSVSLTLPIMNQLLSLWNTALSNGSVTVLVLYVCSPLG